jgi:hypothetical protein
MTIFPPLIDRYLVTLRDVGLDCEHPNLKAITDQMNGEELILLGKCLVEEGKSLISEANAQLEALKGQE